jgi:hypothetical protein
MSRTAGSCSAGHVWPVTAFRISVMLDALHSGRVVARTTWSARSTSASLTRFAAARLTSRALPASASLAFRLGNDDLIVADRYEVGLCDWDAGGVPQF